MNRRKAKKAVKKKYNLCKWPEDAPPRLVAEVYRHFNDRIDEMFKNYPNQIPLCKDVKILRVEIQTAMAEEWGSLY